MSTQFNEDGAVFKLELDGSNFQRNAKRARESFSDFANKTVDKIHTVRQQFTNYLVNDLALNAIKGAFEKSFEFLSNFANESKELVKIADAIDAPVEAISELQAIAKGAEVDLNDLADAANALDFDALSTVAPDLGLNLDELQTKDAAERLAAVLDALNKMPDATARASTAAKLFGDSADGLKTILDGSTRSTQGFIDAAREAGLIANDASARGAAQFADALAQLKDAATGVANAFAVALLPAFMEGASMLTDVARALSGVSAQSENASFEIDRTAAAMRKAREEGDELRKLDAEKFRFVEDLAGQGALLETTFEKAVGIVDELQARYGELGFVVDKAARSITVAAGAQEKFNEAARANERAELEREIAATEAKERDLQARSQKKLDAYNSFGARVASMPRNYASMITGGVVESTSDKWSGEIQALGDQILEERKRLAELRKRLGSLDDANEKPTIDDAPNLPTREGEESNESISKESITPETNESISNESITPETNESISNESITPETKESSAKESISTATNAQSTQAAPPSRSVDASTERASSRVVDVRLSGLDAQIAQYEERMEREKLSSEEARIFDVRKEESAYRSRVESRIVEERSKGKSGQDVALIDELQKKIEESTTRESERVALIEKEIEERRLEEAERAAKNKPEGIPGNILATALPGEEGALSVSLEEGDELTRSIQEKLAQEEKPALDDERFAELLEDPDYFDRAYRVAEETTQGTAATFSAFDAANAANGQNEERALKEAERQTRLLENIERAIRNQAATFA